MDGVSSAAAEGAARRAEVEGGVEGGAEVEVDVEDGVGVGAGACIAGSSFWVFFERTTVIFAGEGTGD